MGKFNDFASQMLHANQVILEVVMYDSTYILIYEKFNLETKTQIEYN